MKSNIESFAEFICSQVTYNELSSLVPILTDVLSGNSDIELKKEEKDYPNYRKFEVDPDAPRVIERQPEKDYREHINEWEAENGRMFKAVNRRKDSTVPPAGSICEHCNAPEQYLYLNGSKSAQLLCKVCKGSTPTHRNRQVSSHDYGCPHCDRKLAQWKENAATTVYKCTNMKCSHYLNNKASMSDDERQLYEAGKSSHFKLHYQYRDYHYTPDQLEITAAGINSPSLSRIHNNLNVVGFVLTYTISLGLSCRQTRIALQNIHGIKLSHQTVLNYMNARSLTRLCLFKKAS